MKAATIGGIIVAAVIIIVLTVVLLILYLPKSDEDISTITPTVIPFRTCESDKDCSGHGVCAADHICQCDPGFAGPNCSQIGVQCPQHCSGHGHM